MKNPFAPLVFLLALWQACGTPARAQSASDEPTATIHFVRTGSYKGSACRSDIKLPNQEPFILPVGGVVNYTLRSTGEIQVMLELNCPGAGYVPASSSAAQLIMQVKAGGEYYVLFGAADKAGFREVGRAEVEKLLATSKNVHKQAENPDRPINRNAGPAARSGKGQATCFLLSATGHLLTNYHCVENAREITIKGLGGDFTTRYAATVVATDQANDLAILQLSNKNLKFAAPPFAIRSTGVAQAERVYALGYPNALAMGEEVKITEGIISAKSGVHGDLSKFQISAAVNPGNSGGPLIDEQGNLIGVVYSKSTVAESAGYAIKASYLEAFLKNVDGIQFPILVNSFKAAPFTDKVAELKNCIFIIETN